jgi:uncharacterized protein (DUF1330 family)
MKKRHYLTQEDIEKCRSMIEVENLQQWKVAEAIGVHVGTVEKICKRLGLKTQRTGPRNGPGHTKKWKGGRTKLKGYWHIYCPGHPYAKKQVPYVAEHRLIMEKHLGRYLLRSEVCHHIDGNRENNALENLIVFQTNGQHLKAELTGRIPNWTPEGFANMCRANPRWLSNDRLRAKYGDGQQPQPIDHQTSQSESSCDHLPSEKEQKP